METKFQTSFIPKKPITTSVAAPHHTGTSVFMMFSIFLFVVSLAAGVGSFAWINHLNVQQVTLKKNLEKSRQQFDEVLIGTLKKANTKIDLSAKLLNQHLAVSEIFEIIGQLTAESIRFSTFTFTAPTDKEGVKITMRGVGKSFSAVAFQSDVFGASSKFGTNKILKNPILSDIVVDQNGNVGFTFTSTLDPANLSYSKIFEATVEAETTTATSTN